MLISSACALHDLLAVVIDESTLYMTDSIWDGSVLAIVNVVLSSCKSWAITPDCELTVV
jgi:hypothetical protein